MGDSYREAIRAAKKHQGKMAGCVDRPREKAIRRAALRQKHGAVARTAGRAMAPSQASKQLRMF